MLNVKTLEVGSLGKIREMKIRQTQDVISPLRIVPEGSGGVAMTGDTNDALPRIQSSHNIKKTSPLRHHRVGVSVQLNVFF